MDDAPGEALLEAAMKIVAVLSESDPTDGLVALLADNFVSEDRRKIVGLPELDKASFIEDARSFRSVAGIPLIEWDFLAVRGHHLGLSKQVNRYGDVVREYLIIAVYSEDLSQMERAIRFDVGDLDAALAELDRLHAEIEAQAKWPAGAIRENVAIGRSIDHAPPMSPKCCRSRTGREVSTTRRYVVLRI